MDNWVGIVIFLICVILLGIWSFKEQANRDKNKKIKNKNGRRR